MLSRLLNRLNLLLKVTGALALTAMMLLTVTDVTGRLFKSPIFGSVELVGFLAVIVMAAALPYTYEMDGHVGVEIFLRLLPEKWQLAFDIVTRTLSFALFSVIAWQMFVYAADLKASGEVSMNLEFPAFYIVYVLAACLAVFSLTIFQRIVDVIKQSRKPVPK